ncbi:ABC transporter ATP-binding protein [Leptospira biflexa]|jgi:manganese/zinc/iron transport system ATP- binding protein|uniref:metal ABC transporter ATP-binding protein n=1 Tax=Leptospira biflexa TaxID=172 RepID=UPI000165A294|nr:ATP-binding cassette domain-containing protein [Leptospira biflexa]ABZ93735.1 ATP-binding protein of an ABC transporter complex [Leptospira biflexa serovar Patoc strain 'Patoc 1 (Ames)']TGM48121.1 ABC transporter ATP-binding protein [Leptospira biflexa]TGM49414.1 ABC transporter ATP-binding protein [Leptospira biflexa]
MQATKPNSLSTPSTFIHADHLSVGYRKEFPVVTDIHLHIEAGKTYALVGGNGAGKTTLFRTLTDLLPPLSGSIQFSNEISTSYVPQAKKMALDFPLRVEDVLLMPKNIGFSFLPKKRFSEEDLALIEKTGVSSYLKKQISLCSGGQLQKVLILRSLLTKANLIFLDEPMDSLDHNARELFQSILSEYLKLGNRSLFFITHSLEHDWGFGFDEVFEIDEGKLYNITRGERPPNCHHHD